MDRSSVVLMFFDVFFFLFKTQIYKNQIGRYKTQYLTVENPTGEALHVHQSKKNMYITNKKETKKNKLGEDIRKNTNL